MLPLKNRACLPCLDVDIRRSVTPHRSVSPHRFVSTSRSLSPPGPVSPPRFISPYRSVSPDRISSTLRCTNSPVKYAENSSSKTFPFMSLAGEMRNQIYILSLASGTVQVLILSKTTYAEAKPLLYKAGILRLGKDGMYFGRSLKDWPAWIEGLPSVPSKNKLQLIQNVTFDINRFRLYGTFLDDARLFWGSWAPRDHDEYKPTERGIMAPFMSTTSVAPRGTCEIVLRNFDKSKRGVFLMSPVLYPLRLFDSFKTVILKITADLTREGWLDQARDFCIEELQGDLGGATWHSKVETFDHVNYSNGYLLFHPREKASFWQGIND